MQVSIERVFICADTLCNVTVRRVGPMDKAPDYESGDSGFESPA